MLNRLSLIISLILFILLLLNGRAIDQAIHHSLLAFMILFGLIHGGLLVLQMIRNTPSTPSRKPSESSSKSREGEPANDS